MAQDVEKYQKPFYCAGCNEKVILKKGDKMIHHFAHEPGSDCEYGKGESEIHYIIKLMLLKYLLENNCKGVEIEKYFKEVRPDVCFEKDNEKVAIEIQKSNISIELITHRMECYKKLGIAVLWLLVGYTQNEYEEHSIKKHEKFLHTLYYGKTYWISELTGDENDLYDESTIKIFDKAIEEKCDLFDNILDVKYKDGFFKYEKRIFELMAVHFEASYNNEGRFLKNKKLHNPLNKSISLINDFRFKNRDVYDLDFNSQDKRGWPTYIPECILYDYKYKNWWK